MICERERLSVLRNKFRPSLFTRNTTGGRTEPSPTDIRVITMMLQCWRRGESGQNLLPIEILLSQVVRHKETFYPSAWARYDLARPGSFRVAPLENRVGALERDYRNMGVMIFGEPPAFARIMETLAALEQEING
jgi:hypothetical protein